MASAERSHHHHHHPRVTLTHKLEGFCKSVFSLNRSRSARIAWHITRLPVAYFPFSLSLSLHVSMLQPLFKFMAVSLLSYLEQQPPFLFRVLLKCFARPVSNDRVSVWKGFSCCVRGAGGVCAAHRWWKGPPSCPDRGRSELWRHSEEIQRQGESSSKTLGATSAVSI